MLTRIIAMRWSRAIVRSAGFDCCATSGGTDVAFAHCLDALVLQYAKHNAH